MYSFGYMQKIFESYYSELETTPSDPETSISAVSINKLDVNTAKKKKAERVPLKLKTQLKLGILP